MQDILEKLLKNIFFDACLPLMEEIAKKQSTEQ